LLVCIPSGAIHRRIGNAKAGGIARVLIALAILSVFASCATPIARIEANPQAYAGEEVAVRGIIVDALNIPGIDLSLYSLSDGTARMPVVAREPRQEGAEVTVEVRVVAIAAEAAADQAATAVDELADYLVEHQIVEQSNARRVARRIMRAIRNAGKGITGSYLLVET
jgi:ribosome-associated translation inhibitor RaiA